MMQIVVGTYECHFIKPLVNFFLGKVCHSSCSVLFVMVVCLYRLMDKPSFFASADHLFWILSSMGSLSHFKSDLYSLVNKNVSGLKQ